LLQQDSLLPSTKGKSKIPKNIYLFGTRKEGSLQCTRTENSKFKNLKAGKALRIEENFSHTKSLVSCDDLYRASLTWKPYTKIRCKITKVKNLA
jgi:hypothetical protein